MQVPLPESPAWWQLFRVEKSELLEVAVAVCNLYALPKAAYAPISKDALREQRHAAAAKQSTAPASPQPEPAKSPMSSVTDADRTNGAERHAADSSVARGGSDDRPTSAGNASVAHQVRTAVSCWCFVHLSLYRSSVHNRSQRFEHLLSVWCMCVCMCSCALKVSCTGLLSST